MLEIIEAVDGPIRGNALFAEKSNAAPNTLETICNTTAEGVRKHLEKVRISDLVAAEEGRRAGQAGRPS